MMAETEAITKRKVTVQSIDVAFDTADDRDIALCLTMADWSAHQEIEPWELLMSGMVIL